MGTGKLPKKGENGRYGHGLSLTGLDSPGMMDPGPYNKHCQDGKKTRDI